MSDQQPAPAVLSLQDVAVAARISIDLLRLRLRRDPTLASLFEKRGRMWFARPSDVPLIVSHLSTPAPRN